jgi:hypothetical protein
MIDAMYTESNTGRLFAITDSGALARNLVEVMPDGSYVSRGAVAKGPYSFTANTVHQMAVCAADEAKLYIFDLNANTLTNIPTDSFLGAIKVDYDDGYFVTLLPSSVKFQISSPLDGTTWNGLDFGMAIGSSDFVYALGVIHRELWLFGSQRIQVFYDAGSASFPFSAIQGVYVEQGIASPETLVKMDNTWFWLGRNERGSGTVYRAAGYNAQRISTHSVEYFIDQYGKSTPRKGFPPNYDAIAFSIERGGHLEYVLTFPSANPVNIVYQNKPQTFYLGATWVYDVTTGLWHERSYLNPTTGMRERWRPNCHAYAYGKHLVGDWKSNTIFELSDDLYDDAGDVIERVRVAPHVNDEMKMISHNRFKLNMTVGAGNVLDPDPRIELSLSRDGGKTYGSPRGKSLGKQGNYKQMVFWDGNGCARRMAYKVVTTTRSDIALVDAYVEIEEGLS